MPEHQLPYPIKRWDLRDVTVLLLIIFSILLAGWVLTLEKTKYIVVVVEESVSKEVKYQQTNSKEKLGEWMIGKLKL
ncbi:MAG: hypothetical protein JSV38_06945 [Desulfobacterales bacterium]|nr:MAG: hypothetical protein JSV38_06945 [Desulfobacterales bacterium]